LESISECLGSTCRKLKILYLQNNIIPKMEHLHHMKELEYLNLALNNIEKIEGLDRCEFLNKLDMTVNFVDFDHLEESISNLSQRHHLRDLYMMGNPSQMDWEEGFEQYVTHRLPQLKCLDGKDLTTSMRIVAAQHFPRLEAELRLKAQECKQRKALESVAKKEAADAKAQRKAAKAQRNHARLKRQEKKLATVAPGKEDSGGDGLGEGNMIEEGDDDDEGDHGGVEIEDADENELRQLRGGLQAVGVHVKEADCGVDAIGEGDDDEEGDEEEEANSDDELHAHTPENRCEMYRELAEEKAEKEAREKERAPKERDYDVEQHKAIERTRKLEEEGRVRQCNEGKWTFSFQETRGNREEDPYAPDDEEEGGPPSPSSSSSSSKATVNGGRRSQRQATVSNVVLDIGVPRHLDSSLIDVDVHPTYVSVVIKSKVLRLNLPAEVDADQAKAQRSKTTGHLVLIMPKCNPDENALSIRVAARDREKKVDEAKAQVEAKQRARDQGKLANQMVTAASAAAKSAAVPTGGAVRLKGLVPKRKGGLQADHSLAMRAVSTTTKQRAAEEPLQPPLAATVRTAEAADAEEHAGLVPLPAPPVEAPPMASNDEAFDDEPPPLM